MNADNVGRCLLRITILLALWVVFRPAGANGDAEAFTAACGARDARGASECAWYAKGYKDAVTHAKIFEGSVPCIPDDITPQHLAGVLGQWLSINGEDVHEGSIAIASMLAFREYFPCE